MVTFALLASGQPAVAQFRDAPSENTAAPRRLALVLGNATYRSFATLANPARDARAMHERLSRRGFSVEVDLDLDRASMRSAVERFASRLREGDVAVVYYSGHGVSVNGTNYLVPIDFDTRCGAGLQEALDGRAISMPWLLGEIESHQARSVFFFDACRDNPCIERARTRSMRRSLGAARGLFAVRGSGDTFIAFATSEGATADDGEIGEHSPFTTALLRHIDDPLDIRLMIGEVRNEVLTLTRGRQRPWSSESLRAPSSSTRPPPRHRLSRPLRRSWRKALLRRRRPPP